MSKASDTEHFPSHHRPYSDSYMSMSTISGIQGQLLEVTVVGCNKLKDTEWISRQDPYVCLEYGSTKFRTRTHTDGGKNPTFQEKFVFTLIEGLPELNVIVWNSNTVTYDDFIGSGKVQLHRVLSQGYDDAPWPLQTKTGRYAGEVRLIMHYANTNKPAKAHTSSAPPYMVVPQLPQSSMYSAPPPPPSVTYPQVTNYSASSLYPAYPPNPPVPYRPPQYHPLPPASYPPPYPTSSVYPPPAYPPPPHEASYYPPPPQEASYYPPSHYPPGPYPGSYPPPPH